MTPEPTTQIAAIADALTDLRRVIDGGNPASLDSAHDFRFEANGKAIRGEVRVRLDEPVGGGLSRRGCRWVLSLG
jgi:hypothetical protein